MSQPNVIDVTPVLDTNILADNDVFMVAYEIKDVFNKNKARKLLSVVVLDTAAQAVDFDLFFSNATITLGTVNQAITISDADAAKLVGSVVMTVSSHSTDLANSTLYTQALNHGIVMQPVTSSLFISGVVRSGTPTFAAGSMKIKLGFE